MTLRPLKNILLRLSRRALAVLVVILGVGVVGAVLVPGFKQASQLVDSTVALKVVADQRRYPMAVRGALDAMHDRLSNRAYLQELVDELTDTAAKTDASMGSLQALATPGSGQPGAGAPQTALIVGNHAARLRALWSEERSTLEPVLAFRGVPYQDNESIGTVLNEQGLTLDRNVLAAIRTGRRVLPSMDAELAAMGNELQWANAQTAQQLRQVMMAGLVIATLLVLIVTMLFVSKRRQDARLREARQQTLDILRTVKDGLFLIDKDFVIGGAYSAALESMFQRTDLAGLAFESLLKDLVSEKTLTTALKFVKILWAERTNEKLVRTINPLGEVEVHLALASGKFDTRYLQFDFHRVRVDERITHVLVSVSDVSARVELARELQTAQSDSQAQVDTLLGILHVDSLQLASFLSDSNAAMKIINAVLREPAREEQAFRKKLDTLFRQAHAVKGEAAALGLSSIESRAHSFEEDLKPLREKSGLSGNDFLPLVIKLDDLLTHLQSVGQWVARLSHLQTPAAAAAPAIRHTDTTVIGTGAAPPTDTGLLVLLQQLAIKVAADNGREAAVTGVGFDLVPAGYRQLVKDVAIQAVRNGVVHGIEPAALRLAGGKPRAGTLRLSFEQQGQNGYKLVIEDDGQGLATDRIKEVALKKRLITAQQALELDARQIYSLLFQPGFSTVDEATLDAGRGVGMNLIADLVQKAGGRVGLATGAGKFTRLSLTLPVLGGRREDTVAA